ncbi:ABC transporter ATP-binding protein [Candidatus Dependentiae bacterium]|nr:ABC transporter ATP-binding protein [Candidatus Dependentiae bacterium]
MSVLEVSNLTKIYQSGIWPFQTPQIYTAVNSISFHISKGEILGFLGTNGAGKTTTIQMLLGTLTPSSGSITYFGTDFAGNRIPLLKKIGYASGYDRLPARLTIYENLDVFGRVYGIQQPQRDHQIEKLLKFFGMWQIRYKIMGGLSAGQVTRVMLAKAFIADPQIVLLDEPTASLDPDVAHEVRQFILTQRKERNISFLITSHNMEEVTELCDRVLVLKNGTIIADNTPEQLARLTSKARIHLTFDEQHRERVCFFLSSNGVSYTMLGIQVMIELDEHLIAQFLADLGKNHLMYTHITIDKPSLKDYFLSIARSR